MQHKNPKEYILWHRLGLAYEDIGESTLAKESFDKAKLLKNENIQILYIEKYIYNINILLTKEIGA